MGRFQPKVEAIPIEGFSQKSEEVDQEEYWRNRALKAEKLLRKKAEDKDTTDTGFEDRKKVFELWKSVFNKKRGVFRSGDKRDRSIQSRLKEWSLDDVCKCIEGYSMDPWRHAQPSRHELSTLLRNDGQIEAGLEIYDDGGKNAKSARNAELNSRKRKGGNSTIDYTDEDRGDGVPGVRGNKVRGGSPLAVGSGAGGGTRLRRDDEVDVEEVF